jgi:hypothetical protein
MQAVVKRILHETKNVTTPYIQRNQGSNSGRGGNSPVSQGVQAVSGAHPASHIMGIRVLPNGVKQEQPAVQELPPSKHQASKCMKQSLQSSVCLQTFLFPTKNTTGSQDSYMLKGLGFKFR